MADGNLQAPERWYATAELVGLPGLPRTPRGVLKMAEREGWQQRPRAKGKGNEYSFASLPAATQTHLLLKAGAAVARAEAEPDPATGWTDDRRASVWRRYEAATRQHKATAERRLKALDAVRALVAGGMGLVQARQTVSAQLRRENMRGGSVASLARWERDIEGVPADCRLPVLLPAYAGRTSRADMPALAWDLFKADYLRLSAPSATSCYERLERRARQEGWELPSLRTFMRRIETEIARPVLLLAREGEEALMRSYPAQIRDHGVFGALEAVNADGHRFDVFCRWPDGTVARPTGVFWQCIGSGKMLSRRIGETENSDLVRLSFADMARRYGLPRHAWMDNGRGFANKFLTGGTPTRYRFKVREDDPVGVFTQLLGAENIHWATPHHGQAKPIERAFRDFADRVSKHPSFEGAYTGHKPDAKPENYGTRAVPIEEFMRVLDEEIVAHNARAGRRGGVCNGRSFDQVFAASYSEAAVRKATSEQLRALLLCSDKVRTNSRDGSITLAGLGNRYWTEALAPHTGTEVLVRFDPDDLHSQVSVYTLAGDFIADAPCTAAVGFADTQAGREHARARKQYRRAAKDQLAAERRMTAAKVAAQIPAPPPEDLPQAAVIQGVFGRGEPRPADAQAAPLPRTGTDDETTSSEVSLADYLKRLQARQNTASGFDPDNQ